MRALVLNQVSYSDAGHIGRSLSRRGVEWDLVYREVARWQEVSVADYGLLVLLGSMWSPLDGENPAIAAEIELVQSAYETGTPVLGICYGAQLMAAAEGGALFPLDDVCLGYRDVRFADGHLPNGRQFFWNHVGFDAPPGTRVLAVGPRSCWAFERPGGVALQFHVDATPAILRRWTTEGADELETAHVHVNDVLETAERVEASVERFSDLVIDRLLETTGRPNV